MKAIGLTMPLTITAFIPRQMFAWLPIGAYFREPQVSLTERSRFGNLLMVYLKNYHLKLIRVGRMEWNYRELRMLACLKS